MQGAVARAAAVDELDARRLRQPSITVFDIVYPVAVGSASRQRTGRAVGAHAVHVRLAGAGRRYRRDQMFFAGSVRCQPVSCWPPLITGCAPGAAVQVTVCPLVRTAAPRCSGLVSR